MAKITIEVELDDVDMDRLNYLREDIVVETSEVVGYDEALRMIIRKQYREIKELDKNIAEDE